MVLVQKSPSQNLSSLIKQEYSWQEKNLKRALDKKANLFSNSHTTPTQTSEDPIIEFLKNISSNEKALVKVYNLIMLVDESTKQRYKNQSNVILFQENLWKIIINISSTINEKNAKNLAHIFIRIGTHRHEKRDETIANIFKKKFNTTTVKKLKFFIKEKITQKSQKFSLNTGISTRNQFYWLLNKYSDQFQEKLPTVIQELVELNIIKEKEPSFIQQNQEGLKRIFFFILQNQKITDKFQHIRISNIYRKVIAVCHEMGQSENFKKEIKFLKNFIRSNPHSQKHAAEHKKIQAIGYKFTIYYLIWHELTIKKKIHDNALASQLTAIIYGDFSTINLKKIDESIIGNFPAYKEPINQLNHVITKQERIIRRNGSYKLLEKKDFNLSRKIEKLIRDSFKKTSLNFKDCHKEMLAQATSYLLTIENALENKFLVCLTPEKSASSQYIELSRAPSHEFTMINSSKGREQKLNDESIINPFTTEVKIDDRKQQVISSQFHCGIISSQQSARQYLAKMLLDNFKQNLSDKTIFIVDVRLIKNGLFKTLEHVYLKSHRHFIDEEVKALNQYIELNQHDLFNEWVSNSGITFSLERFDKLNSIFIGKKKIKFLSFNFSAYSYKTGVGHGIAGRVSTRTKKDLKFLYTHVNNLKDELPEKLNKSNLKLLTTRLEDLKLILDNKKHYFAGHNSLATAMVTSDILNLFKAKMSIGCRSNKDRGSNALNFNLVTKSIFAYRKQQHLENANISYYNFTLKTEEEKNIVWQVLWQNISYSTTLYNTGWAGNISFESWIKPLIVQASGDNKSLRQYYKKIHEFSINAET